MKNSREYEELKLTLGKLQRSPLQVNKLFEADCEILKMGPKNFLATSIDSISEEIDLGLYQEVETWAWISVMSSVSDLAASGTIPLGLTISAQWKYNTPKSVHSEFYKAVNLACKKAHVTLLGGDTGNGVGHSFTTSIIGTSAHKPLMRTGIEEGDLIVIAHQKKTGIGPSLAYRFLLNETPDILPEKNFRPIPSWKLANQLAPLSRAAIDTSDGIATSLYILAGLNDLGVELQWNNAINALEAQNAIAKLQLSPLFLWLGDHGDFQTMFVIPQKNIKQINLGSNLSVIGKFTKKKKDNFIINYYNQKVSLPIADITRCERDIASYSKLIKELQIYLSSFK